MIEKNKKLAELLGEEYEDNSIVISRSQVCGVNPSGRLWQEVRYHFDWEWIMKVVNYIENIVLPNTDNCFNVTIGAGLYCVIQDAYGELVEISTCETTKILSVFEACVQFAEWYEKQR